MERLLSGRVVMAAMVLEVVTLVTVMVTKAME